VLKYPTIRIQAQTDPEEIGRVPLDKEEGFVKGEDILSGAEHRLLSTSESVGPRLWDITAESLFWWIAPPNHRYDRNDYHDSSIRTSSRRVCAEVGNTGGVSKALAPSSA
jgi:hypothetical protein